MPKYERGQTVTIEARKGRNVTATVLDTDEKEKPGWFGLRKLLLIEVHPPGQPDYGYRSRGRYWIPESRIK